MAHSWHPRSGGGAQAWFPSLAPPLTDYALTWDVTGGAVTRDFLVAWDVAASVQRDLTALWDIRSAVALDFSISWDQESATVSRDYAVEWDSGGWLTADYALAWNSAGGISRDYALAWSTITAAQHDVALTWDMKQAAQRDFALSWSAVAAVERDIPLGWNLVTTDPVSADYTIEWDVFELSAVTRDFSPVWSILGQPVNSWFRRFTGAFNAWAGYTGSSVSATYTVAWSVVAAVSRDYAVSWDTGILGSIEGGGDLPLAVQRDYLVEWATTGNVSMDYGPAWDVFGSVSQDYAISWSITLSAVWRDLSCSWSVAGLPGVAQRDFVVGWDTLNSASQDYAVTWSAVRAVVRDYALAWNLLQAAAISGLQSSALRMSAWPPATRSATVRIIVSSGSPEGHSLHAASSSPGIVAVQSGAVTDAQGEAVFALDFLAPGRSEIVFTGPAGVSDNLLAVSRELA